MRFPAKIVVLVLPFFLTACIHLPFHKQKKTPVSWTAPPIESTPPAPAPKAAKVTPPPVVKPVTPPAPPPVVAATPKPKPPAAHHRRTKPKPVEQASIEPPAVGPDATPAISAIGQLSSGEPSALSSNTLNSIEATERDLKNIKRQLNDAEQKTAAQIREFLKQARVALNAGDVDGASTLAAKAKVLLGELTQ